MHMALVMCLILFGSMHEKIVCACFVDKCIWCKEELEEKYEKYKENSTGMCNWYTTGAILPILVCEVVYISCTTYMKFVEIAPIVFELQ